MKNRIPANYAIALTASLGLFMAILDNTIINVALTPIGEALKTSPTAAPDVNATQWIITAYFLAQAAIIPAAGYLSERFGLKRVFILALILFTFGSLLCGLAKPVTDVLIDAGILGAGTTISTALVMLIAFRVVQGIGGGALAPLAQAITFQSFPPDKRAAAGAVIGIPILLAPTFGPTIGGLLQVSLGWEYIFFVNIPVGALAVFLALRIFPADKLAEIKSKFNFDYIGLALSIIGTLALVYGFNLVSQSQADTATATNPRGIINGWDYWLVWVYLIGGILTLAVFAFYELKISKDPVLDLRLFANYNFTIGSILTWASSVVVFGSIFMLPVFLEQVRVPHLSALDAGLALMPQGLAAGVAVAIGGRLYNRLGVRTIVVFGATLLIFSSWELSQLTPDSDGLTLLPWLVLRGLGFGFTAIPIQTLSLQSIVGRALPKASSLFAATRQIATSVGVAAIATVFVQQTSSYAEPLANQARQNLPPGTTFDPNSPAFQQAQATIFAKAGTMAINDIFFYVMFGSILIFVIAFALPGRAKTNPVQATEGETQRQPVAIME